MTNSRLALMFTVVAAVVLAVETSIAGGAEENAPKASAEASQADAKTSAADAEPSKNASGDKKNGDEVHGIELGKFDVRMHRAVPSQSNRVGFTLYATVQPDEAKHFEQLLDHRENKIREQVIVATRLVPVEDFDDADLTKFRRRVLLRLRRTLPELAIDNVYVSDFELVVENN
jgi:hypothetical protein